MAASIRRRPARTGALLLLVPALCLTSCSETPRPARATGLDAPHSVTLTVEGRGTADVNWSTATGGKAAQTTLPWHTTVQAPTGRREVTLSLVLGQHGGQATCSIAIDGRRVNSSLAQGKFGRATCHTPIGTDNGANA
ncbi:hypothetical protein ABT187_28665 [Streptomyces sp. NPDC001817]|uniref:hypothetical protein n=1 Tax=Streptomyces sp. NPDC001817 TaxID=3154398 RepID=UPI003323BB39